MDAAGILSLVLIAYSIILHEIAHGYAALKFGDETALRSDRITLNPIPHLDPIGTIIFPLVQYFTTGRVFIGWARPVPVNIYNLEPRVAGEVVVAVAGVAVNFAIAVAMAILLGIESLVPARSTLFEVLAGTMFTNLALMVFNLLPVPPLDGHHVLKQVLPAGAREQYERLGFNGTLILLALIATGILDRIITPPLIFLANLLWENITIPLRGS